MTFLPTANEKWYANRQFPPREVKSSLKFNGFVNQKFTRSVFSIFSRNATELKWVLKIRKYKNYSSWSFFKIIQFFQKNISQPKTSYEYFLTFLMQFYFWLFRWNLNYLNSQIPDSNPWFPFLRTEMLPTVKKKLFHVPTTQTVPILIM